MAKKKHKLKKRTRRILGYTVFALILSVFIFSSVALIKTLLGYRKSRKNYDNVAEAAIRENTEAAVTEEKEETAAPEETAAVPVTPVPEKEKPPVEVDWEELKALCPDAVAWIYSEGTPISYPVVQGVDNDYYLTHAATGENSAGGAIFMDFACDADTSENVVLYGHRMKDKSMFGSIPGYAEKSYYLSHPVLYLITEAAVYRADVYACRTVKPEWDYFVTSFQDGGYEEYAKKAVVQSYWASQAGFDTTKRTLTLVTCSTYTHETDPRLLVHAFLTKIA